MTRFFHASRHGVRALLIALALVVALGAGSYAKDDDLVTITIAQGVDAESGDPANQVSVQSLSFGALIFDNLVTRAPDMSIQPSLATEWHLVDDVTWEFKLRDDVVFHDGTPLTADDVVFSFMRILDEDSTFRRRPNIAAIKEVVKIDDYTVHIITHEPHAVLLSRLIYSTVVPKHYVEAVGDEEFSRRPIGSGPFKFVEWTRDDRAVLERWDGYWRGPAKPDRVVLRTIPEASTRFAALKAGEVDIITNLPPDLIPEVEADPNLEFVSTQVARVMFVGMNTFEPPLDDVRVRQALNYAIDKEGIVEWMLDGLGYPHGTLFGQQVFGWDDSYEPYPYDPEKAKQLLAEAGYPDGIELEFNAPRGRYLMDAELAEAIAGELARVGVRTNLTIYDWGTYWPKTHGGEHKHLWFLGLSSPLIDPDDYFQLYLSSRSRGGYFQTPEIDAKVFAQAQIMDPDERRAAIKELVHELMEEAPWIFLWDEAGLYAKRKDIVGWEPRADSYIDVFNTTRQ